MTDKIVRLDSSFIMILCYNKVCYTYYNKIITTEMDENELND